MNILFIIFSLNMVSQNNFTSCAKCFSKEKVKQENIWKIIWTWQAPKMNYDYCFNLLLLLYQLLPDWKWTNLPNHLAILFSGGFDLNDTHEQRKIIIVLCEWGVKRVRCLTKTTIWLESQAVDRTQHPATEVYTCAWPNLSPHCLKLWPRTLNTRNDMPKLSTT